MDQVRYGLWNPASDHAAEQVVVCQTSLTALKSIAMAEMPFADDPSRPYCRRLRVR